MYNMVINLQHILPIFFGIFLTSSLLIILVANPIHSVLFLVLLFCNSALILLFFGIEFLSIMLIIIYVGAIAILFLFVVMMLDIKIQSKTKNDFYNYLFFCIFIFFTFFFETFLSISDLLSNNFLYESNSYLEWVCFINQITNTATIGQLLYTFYLSFFLIAGIILLIALIGAVTLTHKKNKYIASTLTYKQMSRLKKNAMFLLK